MEQIELIEKRKPREKHFLQKDGTIRAEIYSEDVHYLKDGKYVDIDNTLIKQNDSFVNKSNDYKAEFKEDFRTSLMKMSKNDHYIDFKLKNLSKMNLSSEKRILSNKTKNITFNNISDDISIEYQTLSNKVKETIVLQNANYSELSFDLDTNLNLEEQNGEILAKDDQRNVVFRIEKPFMVDSNGVKNDNIHYLLCTIDEKYVLTLVLDVEWLNSSDRKFPIYIDPTIINTGRQNVYQDTYIYPGDSTDEKAHKIYLKAGVEKINGVERINRTLMKFDLPTLSTGDEIIYASLKLTSYYTIHTDPVEYVATIHRVTSDWDENSANWNNMSNQYDENIESIFKGTRSPIIEFEIQARGNYYDGNITNLVKEWYKDTPNYGIMIKSYNEKYVDDDFPIFYSNDNIQDKENSLKPILQIEYRNQNGLEKYLDYNIQSFLNGTGYVNTYNGNLTTVFTLGYTVGGNLPISLNLVYNTNDVLLQKQNKFGIGYKLNLQQKITDLVIDNVNYLAYLDEDGTTHYFKESEQSNTYIDEDGLNLTVVKNMDNYEMKDDNGNSMIFSKIGDEYALSTIRDVNENEINIFFNDEKEIIKVTDNYDNSITLEYNNDNIVVCSPSLTTILSYVNDKLYKITSNKGETIFSYNDKNLIESITDINKIKIKYDYYLNSPYKVKKVTQFGSNNEEGESYTLDYGFDSTKLVDNKNRCNTLIFNSNGNLLSTSCLSSEDDIDNAYSVVREYGVSSNIKNRILSSTIPFKSIKNLLFNTSFEKNDINFVESSGMKISISSETSNLGNNCLKCISSEANSYLYQNISVPKGSYYTFSAYMKADVQCSLELSYTDSNNNVQKVEELYDSTDEFERNDVTIYYSDNAISDLTIKIISKGLGDICIDDIQLEVGEVANSYNIIENNDFKNGYDDWNIRVITFDNTNINIDEYISNVLLNNNKSSALRVKGNLMKTFVIEKTLAINGKANDLYSFSFWFKNNGIPGLGPVCGTNVSLYFKPVGRDAEYCIPISDNLNVNRDKWQYFMYRDHAIEDYESIRILITVGREANDFYITNLSFNKELTSGEYSYDQNGNLVMITDQSNNKNIFNYDENNQLISISDPMGRNMLYEYDKNKKDRVINAIASNGISNQIRYDHNGNPIITKFSKTYDNNLKNGLYKIRSAGTNKYLKAELSMVLLEENECSNTIWKLEKMDDRYKIINGQNESYNISCYTEKVCLNTANIANTFELEKNLNGSYHIKYIDKTSDDGVIIKFLVAKDNLLEFVTYFENESDIEFYFEKVEDLFIENNASYTSNGRFINDVTKSSLRKMKYNIDHTTGLINSTINPKNIETFYTYDSKKQCTSISQGDISIKYNYNEYNLLDEIIQGNIRFNFKYNNFLNLSSIKINNIVTLVEHEYESNNGNLVKTTYGNGNIANYEYDIYDRIKKLKKMDDTYTYYYDNNGNISKITSKKYKKKYLFDKANRLYLYNDDEMKVKYTYNSENDVIRKDYRLNNISNYQENVYDDEKLIKTSLDDIEVTYGYDSLARNTEKNINNQIIITKKFISNGKRTTNNIEEYCIGNEIYKYVYDELCNITEIYLNDKLIKKYEYDIYNELIVEYNYDLDTLVNYTYDTNGNIIQKNVIQISTNSIVKSYQYTYENNDWKDQLTLFDNKNITYDDSGNMISYGKSNYAWINGNELESYNNILKNINVKYEYNEDGIRTAKNVNGVLTKYHLVNSNIIYEEKNNNLIYYLYDEEGLVGLEYNGEKYLYIKNLCDDVLGIIDSKGNKVASYVYDSWGQLLEIKDQNGCNISLDDITNIAVINPFRYRSYYYDIETGLYYLKRRYYNPEIGRFISPDIIIGSNQDIISTNLYSYVSNDPINNIDNNGCKLTSLFKILKLKAMVKVLSFASKVATAVKKVLNISSSYSREKEKIPTSNFGYNTTTTNSTVTKGPSNNDNALFNIETQFSDGNYGGTSISTNFSHVNYSITKSDTKIMFGSSLTVNGNTSKLSLGMNSSGEFCFKFEYEQQITDYIYKNISSEEEFSKYLTEFVIVTALVCACPESILTLASISPTPFPSFRPGFALD